MTSQDTPASSQGTPASSQSTPATVDEKGIVLVLMGLGAPIGIVPYVLLTRWQWMFLLFTIIVVVCASFGKRPLTLTTKHSPGILEFLLAGLFAIMASATVGLGGWGFYQGGYVLGRLIHTIAAWFGRAPAFQAETLGFWISLPMVVLMGVGISLTWVERLTRLLYPDTAGLRSAFYWFVTFQRAKTYLLLMGSLATVAGGIVVALAFPRLLSTWWFPLVWGYAWLLPAYLPGLPRVQESVERRPKPKEVRTIVPTLEKMFQLGGYEVVSSPRTGREDIDPLLVRTPDFYAQSGNRGFAVEVKTGPEPSEEESRSAFSELSSAAWALDRFLTEGNPSESIRVEPLVVLVGLKPSLSMKLYEMQGQLRVLQIEDASSLDRIMDATEEEKARALANQYLNFPTTDAPASAST